MEIIHNNVVSLIQSVESLKGKTKVSPKKKKSCLKITPWAPAQEFPGCWHTLPSNFEFTSPQNYKSQLLN